MFYHIKLTVICLAYFCLVSAAGVSNYSSACGTTLTNTGYINTITNCNTLVSTSEAKLALVTNGFCTELEFYNFVQAVCGTTKDIKTVSEAKTSFYTALNNVSAECQANCFTCFGSSLYGILLKQQEKFCNLMKSNLNIESLKSCLAQQSAPCTSDEFNRLQSAACVNNNTSADQKFSNAVLGTTSACQSKISFCSEQSDEAKALIKQGQYCKAFSIKAGTDTTESCFTSTGGCTAVEFSTLKYAACDATFLTWSIVTIATSYIISCINLV